MGLGLDRNQLGQQILRRVSCWQFPAIMVIVSGLFELFGDPGRTLLQYDRAAIGNAELWRLISGHLVHLSPSHYLLNATGLILVWLLVGTQFTTRQWVTVTVIAIMAVNLGLWIFNPEIVWYVGMSGVLHGLLFAGVIAGIRTAPREAFLIGIVLAAKIGFEQFYGPMPGSEHTAGGKVVVDAHLYGAVAGAGAAAVFWKTGIRRI